MRRRHGRVLLSACLLVLLALLGSCTGKAEAVRAAQPYVEDFGELRVRALSLLELRSDVQRQRLLADAMKNGDEESLPANLKLLLERMRAERVEITDQRLEHGEALFWRMLDYSFAENPNVLQGEIVFLEKDGSLSSFRHPRETALPAGVKWYGLRAQRTFAGLTNCMTNEGSEPCVLLQLRPRDYPGNAGLTVAYRRTPLEVTADPESAR
ncbi:MAG: hypothetical protein JRJ80_00150 [Deltaproteobacteria bacterium]|nr:hypothetical protein [Deltaproteobacteria bacterium]MBW2159017.1 hypothetical protein [Deltaproteobacteria bacterium]